MSRRPWNAIPLRLCPFDGGKAKLNELRRGNYRREGDNYQVVCNKCRARGPLVQDSPAAAVYAWNALDRVAIKSVPNPIDAPLDGC